MLGGTSTKKYTYIGFHNSGLMIWRLFFIRDLFECIGQVVFVEHGIAGASLLRE